MRGWPSRAQSNPLLAPAESNPEFGSSHGGGVLSAATTHTDDVAAEAVVYSAPLVEVLFVTEFAALAAVVLTASL